MIRGVPPPLWKDKPGFKRRWKPGLSRSCWAKVQVWEAAEVREAGVSWERGVGEPMEVRKQAPSGEGE